MSSPVSTLDGLEHLSASRLMSYIRCPRRFLHSYIRRDEWEDVPAALRAQKKTADSILAARKALDGLDLGVQERHLRRIASLITDMQAKYYVLLARGQARNPNWMQKAIATYGRAMQLSGQDLQIRLELAQLLETSGDLDRARREYDAILKRQPSHSQASQALERLRTKPRTPSADGGWLDKLRSRLPRGKK